MGLMTTRRDIPPPDVLFVQPDGRTDHFAGVAEELARFGLRVERQDEEFRPPRVRHGTRVVAVSDVLDPRSVRALRMARRVDARTVLMMDGLAEWRNTFVNPRTGDGFLRPAPVDVICCSGLVDVRTLTVLGNRARPTGLPRIDRRADDLPARDERMPVLVATANTPAFDDAERERLKAALGELKQAAYWTRTRLVWRLTDGLAEELGVTNHTGALCEALGGVSAVITTPSTLMIEAMRSGRPCALLHAHETALWSPSAWVWQPVARTTEDHAGVVEPIVRNLTRWVDSPERLLRQIVRPTREQLDRQRECLALVDASSGDARAAELVAGVISEMARTPAPAIKPVPLRPVARIPSARPRREGRRRVVSVVPFDLSPIGGVTTWSMRLGEAFERCPDLGFDLHTVLVCTKPPMALSARPLLGERVSLCVLDPTDDHFVSLANLRRAIQVHEPEIVLPNYTAASHAVSSQLRHTGVRSVAIAHTDCAYYRELLSDYPGWDGAVAVSASIERWLSPLAGQRPLQRIVYGVPSSSAPRGVGAQGPLRLAYVGRVAQVQKRVMDLVPMARALAAMGVECELHVVGEGPELPALRRALGATGCVRVIFHGPRTPGYLQGLWPEMDVAVLVSEYEGTSITMLEAMAHGVVPAVTLVESGVGEWVEEGVSGVTAPVGEPVRLAERIAELDADRALLASLGARAHERVSRELGLDQMARRYAELFRSVLARPIQAKPTAAGVTIRDRYAWTKQHTEDATGEIAWVRARLTEAGFRSIALRSPSRHSDAVIIPAGDAGPDPETLKAWQERGIEVVWSSLQERCGALESHLEAITLSGFARIAIYGAGRHTQSRCDSLETGRWPVVGFIDDHPPASREMLNLPAVTPARAMAELRPDAVLISSDAWEQKMWANTAFMREAGVHVRPMYGSYAEAPALSLPAG